ncbi:hypothetical protein ACWD0A_13440 [Streptomyces sp. NPDC002867]
MRTNWRQAAVLATVTVLLWATPTASQTGSRQERQSLRQHTREQPPDYRADCGTVIEGSKVTAYCHNPYPAADRVQLHVECARWWDVDADSVPVELRPAGYAELTQRCWKEIRAAWISHRPQRAAAGT